MERANVEIKDEIEKEDEDRSDRSLDEAEIESTGNETAGTGRSGS
jgi:hypothetical protein